MDELVKNLINECKQDQELERLYKATHIELDNYFKYIYYVYYNICKEDNITQNTNIRDDINPISPEFFRLD